MPRREAAAPDDKPFEIVLRDGYARIKLRGELDYPATLTHGEALREITDLRTRVVVDLADLQFIDSSGLQFLIRLANAHDGRLRLENVPPNITRILELTGLTERFDIDATDA